MKIPIHALVQCTDGNFGHTTCLILNPINDQITHFVVNDRQQWGKEYIVPISQIVTTTDTTISVKCDCHTLRQQPDFIEYEFDRLDSTIPYREEHIYWPMLTNSAPLWMEAAALPLRHEQIPVGELAARRGMAVNAAASEGVPTSVHLIGHVEFFIADSTTGNVTHLVLRKGHLWGQRDITIPVSAIRYIDRDGVNLRLTQEEIEHLPTVAVKHGEHKTNPV